jgi:2-methylcitrate dehydratase PrpD
MHEVHAPNSDWVPWPDLAAVEAALVAAFCCAEASSSPYRSTPDERAFYSSGVRGAAAS